jgi:hypothetical protein
VAICIPDAGSRSFSFLRQLGTDLQANSLLRSSRNIVAVSSPGFVVVQKPCDVISPAESANYALIVTNRIVLRVI